MTVIPNCIDVAYYSQQTSEEVQAYDILFTGKMDYRPNVDAVLWFAEKIWPEIREASPNATWAIVGQKPHSRLDPIRNLPGVTVTGWVDKILPYVSAANVFVMPFRVGSGTRLKLIEAMAAGKAIVSTSIGAEGFNIQHGEQLLLADDPKVFARDVCRLLGDETEASRLGASAQKFAKQYDWRQIIPKFDAIFQILVGEN
jgi:glycosyltransferase involved in cell wall biosynthesis